MMLSSQLAPVVIAPFSNERVREWPLRNYRDLIRLIWQVHGLRVLLVGTKSQRSNANEIARGMSSEFVINGCGVLAWEEVALAIDAAPYVVANNSGVAHLAAVRERWTLCIFSASHSMVEWMPRGPRVVVVTRQVPCAPCDLGMDRCPNGVACMSEMNAEEVFWRFDDARNDAIHRADRMKQREFSK